VASPSRAASPWGRQDSRQRGKEGAIGGRSQGRPLLPREHDQLMSQDEQLDVFGDSLLRLLISSRSTAEKAR
jgi:hypothetical protein